MGVGAAVLDPFYVCVRIACSASPAHTIKAGTEREVVGEGRGGGGGALTGRP